MVFPSIKYEARIHMGAEKTPNQAVNAKPPISLLIGFASTCAKDHIQVPESRMITPKSFPSKFGLPVKKIIPIEATINPMKFLKESFSPNNK